jgi:hypothetical protein
MKKVTDVYMRAQNNPEYYYLSNETFRYFQHPSTLEPAA